MDHDDISIGELSVGDILSRGMSMFGKRLPYFFIIQFVVLLPSFAMQAMSPFVPVGVDMLVLITGLVLGPIGSAAMLRIIVQEYLDGQVSLGEAFQFALGRFLPLLGTSLLVGLCVVVGLFLCCIPGIYMAVIWSMISQVVVVENQSGTQAMGRSRDLVRGHFGQVFGMLFLLGLVTGLLNFGLVFALSAVFPHREMVPGQNPNPFAPGIITNYPNYLIVILATTIIGDLLQAYTAVCVTFMYFELRRRKEGYDLREGYARIARWRERFDELEGEGGLPPATGGPPQTGIKEPGTGVQPWQPPETGIKDRDAGPSP
jgi:hypothetical protein